MSRTWPLIFIIFIIPIDPIFVLDEDEAKTAAAWLRKKKTGKKPFLFSFQPVPSKYYANFNVSFLLFLFARPLYRRTRSVTRRIRSRRHYNIVQTSIHIVRAHRYLFFIIHAFPSIVINIIRPLHR